MARTAAAEMEGPAKLREWRERHGLSRDELAARIGFTDGSSVRNYEHGRRHMLYRRLIAASQLTGISVWDLAFPTQREEMVALAKAVPRRLVLMRGKR